MTLIKFQSFVRVVTVVMCATSATAAQSSTPVPAGMLIAQQTFVDVVNMLETAGYRVLDMKSTFLGRIRIRAVNQAHVRQVVVSRSTGEIKSDQIIQVLRANSDGQSKAIDSQETSSDSSDGVNVSGGGSSVSVGSQGVSASNGGNSVSVGGGGISLGD